MIRMDMDWRPVSELSGALNLKKFKFFHVLLLCPAKLPKKLLWLVVPAEICLISSSQLLRRILFMSKGTNDFSMAFN